MKRAKRVLSLFLSLLLTCGVASCGGAGGTNASSKPGSNSQNSPSVSSAAASTSSAAASTSSGSSSTNSSSSSSDNTNVYGGVKFAGKSTSSREMTKDEQKEFTENVKDSNTGVSYVVNASGTAYVGVSIEDANAFLAKCKSDGYTGGMIKIMSNSAAFIKGTSYFMAVYFGNVLSICYMELTAAGASNMMLGVSLIVDTDAKFTTDGHQGETKTITQADFEESVAKLLGLKTFSIGTGNIEEFYESDPLVIKNFSTSYNFGFKFATGGTRERLVAAINNNEKFIATATSDDDTDWELTSSPTVDKWSNKIKGQSECIDHIDIEYVSNNLITMTIELFDINAEVVVPATWPAESLKKLLGFDLPALTGATGYSYNEYTGYTQVGITGITEAQISAYVEALGKAGFTFNEYYETYSKIQGVLEVTLELNSKNNALGITIYKEVVITSWPTSDVEKAIAGIDIPAIVGASKFVIDKGEDYINIDVEGISSSENSAYIQALIGAGFIDSGYGIYSKVSGSKEAEIILVYDEDTRVLEIMITLSDVVLEQWQQMPTDVKVEINVIGGVKITYIKVGNNILMEKYQSDSGLKVYQYIKHNATDNNWDKYIGDATNPMEITDDVDMNAEDVNDFLVEELMYLFSNDYDLYTKGDVVTVAGIECTTYGIASTIVKATSDGKYTFFFSSNGTVFYEVTSWETDGVAFPSTVILP